ncbi:hypothetical protein BX070DRAFT_255184 [Coemansia spiralis]|nr:hypothetical protein BX070DRAFT_255184 [Coemansia spiralis]
MFQLYLPHSIYRLSSKTTTATATVAGAGRKLSSTVPIVARSPVTMYTTDTQSNPDKPKKKEKPMIINPLSPAIQSMYDRIQDKPTDIDVSKELEKFRFTTANILASLPEHYAKSKSSADPSGSARLAVMNREETLRELENIRNKYVLNIKENFTLEQLKKYLRMHDKRASGNKIELVNRIINSIWGITTKAVEGRLAEVEERREEDGISLELGRDSLEQLLALDPRLVFGMEKENDVKITVNKENSRIKVVGTMHNVRITLSSLRELLTANLTAEIRPELYGTPRLVSQGHMTRISKKIYNFGVGKRNCNITYYNGELFVNGSDPINVLNAQHGLVQAIIEPRNSTLFVVDPNKTTSTFCTVMPATDMFSQQPTSVLDRKLFSPCESKAPEPVIALADHSLYQRGPEGRIKLYKGMLIDSALKSWIVEQLRDRSLERATVSAKFGNVLFDMFSEDSNMLKNYHQTSELMDMLNKSSPLFGFSSHISPLYWPLQSESRSASTSARQLVLKFAEVKSVPETTDGAKKIKYPLPVYGNHSLTAKIDVEGSKVRFSSMDIEYDDCNKVANIAMLQSQHDLQIHVRNPQPVKAPQNIIDALKDVSHKLGISGEVAKGIIPRRHHIIDSELGQFGLQSADLVSTTRVPQRTGYSLLEHQIWNMIDDRRYSEMELVPSVQAVDHASQPPNVVGTLLKSQEEWEKFLLNLFEMAYKRPNQASSSAFGWFK